MNAWELLLLGWALMAVAMAVLWEVQRRYGKAGIVDVLWAGGVGALALFFAWQADGYLQRRFLIGILAGAWSFRLTSYLLVRIVRMAEDGRYEEMKQKWGDATQRNLFLFFQVQAFWSVLFAAPMLLAAQNAQSPLGWMDAAGVAMWILAIYGEAVADRQLARFRMRSANKGKVCRDGLWRYSRHPNYFFEWLHWWAYVLIGWSAPLGYLTLLGPATMLLFLFKITGIPPTEANALKSRGDAYREYQRTTSAFFPWPPKKGNATA
jgi:steroid 5-alpha reductase family enzyme